MGTLKVSKTWLFTLERENGCLIGKLTYMGVEYASIKIVIPTAPNMLYDIESFECQQEINDDDKMLLVNHIVINILLLEGTKLKIPFLTIKHTKEENMNFIKNYIPGCFPA